MGVLKFGIGFLCYWIAGLLVITYVYTSFKNKTKITGRGTYDWVVAHPFSWPQIDPEEVSHLATLTVAAVVWPLVLAVAILVGIVFLVLHLTQAIIRRPLEHR